jgi:hypothetical protein
MRLLRVGPVAQERPAALDSDGVLRELSPVVSDIDGALLDDLLALHRVRLALTTRRLPEVPAGTRIAAPVVRPGRSSGSV